jgi:hypothetical protein
MSIPPVSLKISHSTTFRGKCRFLHTHVRKTIPEAENGYKFCTMKIYQSVKKSRKPKITQNQSLVMKAA